MGCLKLTYRSKTPALKVVNGNFFGEGKSCAGCYSYGFGGHLKDDELYGSGNWYGFGDYGYNPRVVQRPSPDPLKSQFPSFSPYSVFKGNPIFYVDPTGMAPDWYQEKGKMKFDENIKSQEDLQAAGIDGDYLGEKGFSVDPETGSATIYNPDGTTQSGSIGLSEVNIQGTMTDHQRTMKNPIVKEIHQGQNEFLSSSVSLTGDVLEKAGDGITVVGYGMAFIPGAQPAAAATISVGKGMSLVGGTINFGIDVNNGNYGKAAISLGTHVVGWGLGNKIDKASKLGASDKLILHTGSDLKLKMFEKAITPEE